MDKHFLSDLVEGEPSFRQEAWYNRYGDCIIYQTANEAVVADRVDGLLTVYRSAVDNRPIGFQVKGVQAIVEKFGAEGLSIEAAGIGDKIQTISVALLLLVAYEQGPMTSERRRAYAEIMPPADIQAEVHAAAF